VRRRGWGEVELAFTWAGLTEIATVARPLSSSATTLAQ